MTGANEGTGSEIAADLVGLGYRVALGACDDQRRTAEVAVLRRAGVDVCGCAETSAPKRAALL